MFEELDFNNEESSKDKFLRLFNSIRHLSNETKESILNYLEKTDFFTAPASSRFHYNCREGLVKHSIHVAEILQDLTKKNNIVWDNPDSPLLIGLLHDVCKILTYTTSMRNVITGVDEKGKNIWGQQEFYQYNDKKPQFGIHGDKSVIFLLMLRKKSSDFTPQEIACIRWHMGSMQEGELQGYSNAAVVEPNIVWTHLADQMAALTEPIIK